MTSQMCEFGRSLDHETTKSVSLRGIGFLHFFTSLFEGRVEKATAPRREAKYRNGVRGEPIESISNRYQIEIESESNV